MPDDSLQQHVAYQESLASLQRGDWDGAIEHLSWLEDRYPGIPEIQTMLQEARLKASLDQKKPRAKAWRAPVLSNRLIQMLILANILVYLGWGLMVVYDQQIRPTLEQRRQEAVRQKLFQEGQGHLAEGNYGGAIQAFETLLTLSPNEQEAQKALSEAKEAAELASAYDQALALIKSKRWREALVPLKDIAKHEPGYRDVPQLMALAEEQLTLANLLNEAEELYRASDWQGAAAKYEEIQALDLSYQQDLVEARLFDSYWSRGEELVALARDSLHPLREAVELFQKASALHPLEPHVADQRQLAEAALWGSHFYEQGDWEAAIAELQKVHEKQEGYAGGRVTQLLYEAYVRSGDALAQEGDHRLALEQYTKALELTGEGEGETAMRAYEVHVKVGDVYFQKGDYALSIEHYRQALEAVGYEGGPLTEMSVEGGANSEASDGGSESDLEQAMEKYRQAIEEVGANLRLLHHVVQQDETLSQLAFRYHTTVGAIAAANGIADASPLHKGQRLTIPVGFESEGGIRWSREPETNG